MSQEPRAKKNTDEMEKLSKSDRIGPFGFLLSSKVAGIYLLILVPSRMFGIHSHN